MGSVSNFFCGRVLLCVESISYTTEARDTGEIRCRLPGRSVSDPCAPRSTPVPVCSPVPTKQIVVFVLEDCLEDGGLPRSSRSTDLLAPGARIGTFPGGGNVLSSLIQRGHTVIVASRLSPATLSTAAYLYDLEYHFLKSFNQGHPVTGEQIHEWLCGYDWSTAPELDSASYLVVASPAAGGTACTPVDFFNTYSSTEDLRAVTTGRRKTNSQKYAPSAPGIGDALHPLYAELVRTEGWRLNTLNNLAVAACKTTSSAMVRAQAAYWTLTAAPGVSARRVLQRHLLEALSGPNALAYAPEDFYYFDPLAHVFHFHPQLLTRREYRNDIEIRDLYLRALAALFPAHQAGGAKLRVPNVRAVTAYASRTTGRVGSVMGVAKNWQKARGHGSNGCSGENPALSYLPFAAELMAAHTPLAAGMSIVATPATAYSRQRPGEVSKRLGGLVGSILGVPVLPLLQKDMGSIVCRYPGSENLWLVDDQITTGSTLTAARTALTSAGYIVTGATAFSVGSVNSGGVAVLAPKMPLSGFRLRGVTVPA